MTNLKTGLTVAVLMGAIASPAAAQAQLTTEQILQLAVERGVCPGDLVPVSAVYNTATRVAVTCGPATGFMPAAGGLTPAAAAAAAAGLGLVLIVAGDSTDSTTATTSTTN